MTGTTSRRVEGEDDTAPHSRALVPFSPLAHHWSLDPQVIFLNHGSFGACPVPVLEAQRELRERLERQPVQFMARDLEGLLDGARESLAAFLGADPEGLAFVPNATHGVNTVLRSLELEPGDELLVTDHEYRASRNALDYVARRSGAQVVVAPVPFPIAGPEQVLDSLRERISPRTRLLLVDHVTSPTGLVAPLAEIIAMLSERGVDTLVDGAHAPGMLELRLDELGAAYYTGNCHKWLCAPKGAAFLFVRPDRRSGVRPLAISHGATMPAAARSRFRLEMDWTGTWDPTAYLSVPAAIEVMDSMLPGGWSEARRRNRELCQEGRTIVCEALGVEAPAPDSMLGSLAAIALPADAGPAGEPDEALDVALQARLLAEHAIEVPVFSFGGRRVVRLSAQLYNVRAHYERLAAALPTILSVDQ
jgi:isopenicillin-N epimerase